MPTYEYRCKACNHRFDYFQSITADPLSHCPESECSRTDQAEKGTGEVQRLVSGGAGLIFKGDGFYLTDYVRKGDGTSDKGSGESKEKGSETNGAIAKSSESKNSESSGSKASGGKDSKSTGTTSSS